MPDFAEKRLRLKKALLKRRLLEVDPPSEQDLAKEQFYKGRDPFSATAESIWRGAGQATGATDEIMALINSVKKGTSYRGEKENQEEQERLARTANPVGYYGGMGLGTAALGAIPGLNVSKGASLGSQLSKGAALGGALGFMSSDADMTDGQIPQLAAGTGLGALAGAAGPALVKGASAGLERLPNLLKKFSDIQYAKAATGWSRPAMRKLAGKGGRANVEKAGRAFRDQGLVKGFDNTERVGKRAVAQVEEIGPKLGQGRSDIDGMVLAAGDEPLVDGAVIAKRFRKIADNYDTPNTKSIAEGIRKQAASYRKMGRVGLSESEKFKGTYSSGDERFMTSAHEKISNRAQGDMRKALKEISEEAVSEYEARYVGETGAIGAKNPKTLLADYKKLKGQYGTAKKAAQSAGRRDIDNLGINTFSPSTKMAAGGAVMASMAGGGNPLSTFIKGVAFGAANHIARGRGASSMAVMADWLRKGITGAKRYSPQLKAAAVKGNANLAATHAQLLAFDKLYKDEFDQHVASNSGGEENFQLIREYSDELKQGGIIK